MYNPAVFMGETVILLVSMTRYLPAGEDCDITPLQLPGFATEYGNIGMLICWDMQYPRSTARVGVRGADLIACQPVAGNTASGYAWVYENSVTIAAAMGINPAGFTRTKTRAYCRS